MILFPRLSCAFHPIQDVVTSLWRPIHTSSYRVVESNEPSPAFHLGFPDPNQLATYQVLLPFFLRAIRCKKYQIQLSLPARQ
ncbi:hypothetical protein PDIG_11090 [Penicillium digitatum PHI26]|uniref:Uncharacterized protein n=2 Tax=Penicillium digitatum TaxID=36651 RepID=K9GYV5_PEND2|nr:hypothetical protein PDIP_82600 [Penicillium digitatum Pd1]EKV05580.1 hypothetical protein PDIP_82600 [Penicillium digitatum Pd1]EKV18161.1 hypothetical protein PDIG_11090 [Penicillium digitatum PHI26]